MLRTFLAFAISLITVTNLFAQNPPQDFFDGLKIVSTDTAAAKQKFISAIGQSPSFFGSYHFVGALYASQNQIDSAISYYQKALALNAANVNKTAEFTYARLMYAYGYKHDLKMAFDIGWEAHKKYPDSQMITAALTDVCLWGFFVESGSLPIDYLSPVIKPEYTVNTIAQEYLIVRCLLLNADGLNVKKQSLVNKNKAAYDVLTCGTEQKTVEVNFKIGWDMGKEFGGKVIPAEPVISNTAKPLYARAGAKYQLENKISKTKTIIQIIESLQM